MIDTFDTYRQPATQFFTKPLLENPVLTTWSGADATFDPATRIAAFFLRFHV
jgi:hypothetical protein